MSEEGDRASELIGKLDESGLFKGVGYQEIVTACGYIAARSLHDQHGFSAAKALQTIAVAYTRMANSQADLMQKAWEQEATDG